MLIRLTKFTDDKITHEQADNRLIINSCFDYCLPYVQRDVRHFLDCDRHKALTLMFKDFKVRLEKL